MIKKEQSADATRSKKLQSAPRGSRQGWSEQEDLSIDHNEQAQVEKHKKKLLVQNFIETRPKNKFSDWRKSKMGFSDYSEGE
jgi:hypothetical protein